MAQPGPASWVEICAGKRGGRACIRDTRISVEDVLGWLARMRPAEILGHWPELTPADLGAAVQFAAEHPEQFPPRD